MFEMRVEGRMVKAVLVVVAGEVWFLWMVS